MANIEKRDPVLVVILSIITLGIYIIYWFVKTKEEMKSLGADIPTAWLIIVPIANVYLLYKYCEGFSVYVKKDNMGPIWFLVALAIHILIIPIIQVELNKLAEA